MKTTVCMSLTAIAFVFGMVGYAAHESRINITDCIAAALDGHDNAQCPAPRLPSNR